MPVNHIEATVVFSNGATILGLTIIGVFMLLSGRSFGLYGFHDVARLSVQSISVCRRRTRIRV